MIQLPLFADTPKWRAPTYLPKIPKGIRVAVDTETNDPELLDRGPAFLRALGHVAGVSLCWKEATEYRRIYLPFGHLMSEGQLDKGLCIMYLNDVLGDPSRELIFYNAQYDLGWLGALGVTVRYSKVYDVQVMAALYHEENKWRGLDLLAKELLGEGKDETLLKEAAKNYGVHEKGGLWMMPCGVVGSYAETDPYITYRCFEVLLGRLQVEGSLDILNLECEVTPVLLEMMLQGVRIDLPYAEALNARWKLEEAQSLSALNVTEEGLWDPDWCLRFFQGLGIEPPKTDKGNYSMKKGWVESIKDPRVAPYLKARAIARTRKVFLEDTLIRGSRGGRIYPQYVQMASDEGGTRTGRLSCKNPNAQQIPKRSRLFDAKSIRKCLLPEEGCQWSKHDYWSQEPVLQLHFAVVTGLDGTEGVMEAFKQGKKLYTYIEEATHGACTYDQSKGVVLGRSYGMGEAKMAEQVNLPTEECLRVLQAFDAVAPYIKESAGKCMQRAETFGVIKGLMGRPGHFNLWEPTGKRGPDDPATAELDLAKELWGKNIQRAGTYKAYNKLIQGSAATQTKAGMVQMRKALGRPLQIQVHDEVGMSVQNEKEHNLCNQILTNCVKLRAPVRVDSDLGPTWQ